MNEIEKMYENAGIKKRLYCNICNAKEHGLGLCAETDCEPFYPPFTAKKQLKLVKWLFDSIYLLCLSPLQNSENFENSLAELVNDLWQDLAEEEKQQVKGILE